MGLQVVKNEGRSSSGSTRSFGNKAEAQKSTLSLEFNRVKDLHRTLSGMVNPHNKSRFSQDDIEFRTYNINQKKKILIELLNLLISILEKVDNTCDLKKLQNSCLSFLKWCLKFHIAINSADKKIPTGKDLSLDILISKVSTMEKGIDSNHLDISFIDLAFELIKKVDEEILTLEAIQDLPEHNPFFIKYLKSDIKYKD